MNELSELVELGQQQRVGRSRVDSVPRLHNIRSREISPKHRGAAGRIRR